MLVQLPNPTQARPCALRGLGCSSPTSACGQCSGAAGQNLRGIGAFYDSFPAPFNNPLILAAIAIAAIMIFGGGFQLFGGRKSGGQRRKKLAVIRHAAELERAKLLAS